MVTASAMKSQDAMVPEAVLNSVCLIVGQSFLSFTCLKTPASLTAPHTMSKRQSDAVVREWGSGAWETGSQIQGLPLTNYVTFWNFCFLICPMRIQLTLEEQGFELCGTTYMQYCKCTFSSLQFS